jgi:hypothetical protein
MVKVFFSSQFYSFGLWSIGTIAFEPVARQQIMVGAHGKRYEEGYVPIISFNGASFNELTSSTIFNWTRPSTHGPLGSTYLPPLDAIDQR